MSFSEYALKKLRAHTPLTRFLTSFIPRIVFVMLGACNNTTACERAVSVRFRRVQLQFSQVDCIDSCYSHPFHQV